MKLFLLLGCLLPSMVLAAPEYEYDKVVVQAKSECETGTSKADVAKKYAIMGASNKAHEACEALGKGWRYDSVVELGLLGYKDCVWLGNGTQATLTDSIHRCKRLLPSKPKKEEAKEKPALTEQQRIDAGQKELADKLREEERKAAERREKWAAEKEKAEQQAQAKKKEVQKDKSKDKSAGSSIDNAFQALEKGKAPTKEQISSGKAQTRDTNSIDSKFESFSKWRADEENKKAAEAERIRRLSVRITSHSNGSRVNTRVVELRGDTQGQALNSQLLVHFNGASQQAMTNSTGEFSSKVALKSGSNDIKICHADKCAVLQLIADIEQLALMATLTWEGRGDLDLYVEAPNGKRCSYGNKRVPGICTLDIDDQRGMNPENISIPGNAPQGQYRFWVVNYSGVEGVRGTLKLYKNEQLIESRTFVADGRRGSTLVSASLGTNM